VFDFRHADVTHPDLVGRAQLGDVTLGTFDGHPTMTAGMIAGDGSSSQAQPGTGPGLRSASAGQWRGIAPAASIRTYNYTDSGDSITNYLNDVTDAVRRGAAAVVSTYNEPLITSEWAVAVFKEARAAGLSTAFVSNGNGTPQVLEYLRPWIDWSKVDLKSFDDRHYRELGGRLGPILDTIRRLHAMDVWLELVTLLIPGFNDSRDEIERLTTFVAGVSPDIPWHVTAFHGDYKMTDPLDTTAEMLVQAAAIGRANGLRYVYAGNLPGQVGDLEHTCCPNCREPVINRWGYRIRDYRLTADGRCPRCATAIPGRWDSRFAGQITSRPITIPLYHLS
jgi:AmmeMemoRadiSam system radical SAM enzyme